MRVGPVTQYGLAPSTTRRPRPRRARAPRRAPRCRRSRPAMGRRSARRLRWQSDIEDCIVAFEPRCVCVARPEGCAPRRVFGSTNTRRARAGCRSRGVRCGRARRRRTRRRRREQRGDRGTRAGCRRARSRSAHLSWCGAHVGRRRGSGGHPSAAESLHPNRVGRSDDACRMCHRRRATASRCCLSIRTDACLSVPYGDAGGAVMPASTPRCRSMRRTTPRPTPAMRGWTVRVMSVGEVRAVS